MTYQIDAVRVQRTFFDRHEHITAVRLAHSGVVLPLSTVIRNLLTIDGDRYVTYADGQLANVYVRSCPWCASRDYITTSPDGTKLNNLLRLPRC